MDREAEVVSSLYRDVGGYPAPIRDALQGDLKDYTRYVVNLGWQQQRRGIVPVGSAVFIERFQERLLAFEPATTGQQILHAETYKQFNNVVEARRARLNAVTTGLPGSL